MRFILSLFVLVSSPAWADCPPQADIERELIEDACSASLASGPLINPAVTTLAELHERVALMLIPLQDYMGAYSSLTIGGADVDIAQTTTISYNLDGRSYQTWAYTEHLGSSRAALIIPGSGENQSGPIFKHNPSNYHYDIAGITEAEGWDTYVYIKPNEDCLAVHNGTGKLCNDCLMPRLLDAGGSYSARYLVDAMAWVKYLKTQYARTVIIGLSQGGAATLLTALQSEPDGAFVASGWSVLNNGCSGLGTIILPGMGELRHPSVVHDGIMSSSTQYTFSWGLKEIGVYKYDAQCGSTAVFLGDLRNVTSIIHLGEHEFPEKGVIHFLRQFTAPGPGRAVLYQNSPNPFTTSTTIRFALGADERAVLSIYDSAGRLIRTLDCGGNEVKWDGTDSEGHRLPAGVYTYRIGDMARKMVLVR